MANENPSAKPAEAGKNFEGNLGPVEIARRKQEQRNAINFERRVDQLAKSPEITSQLGKIRESALRTTDSVKSGESLKSLADNINEVRNEIKTKGSSEDLTQELAQLKAEQTIWETRHQELVTAKTEARVARAKERTAKIMSELEAQKNIPAPPELPPRDESPVYEENEPEIITDVEDLEDVEEPTEEIAKSTIQQEIAPATQTVELPKKSWIPAGLRKWGLAALALVGIGTAVHEAAPHLKTIGDEATTTVNYAANATASEANREKGLRDAANAARRVEYVRDQALKGIEQPTRATAEALVAGKPVEIAGKRVQMVEKAPAEEVYDGGESLFQGLVEFDKIMEGHQTPEDQLKIDGSLTDAIKAIDTAPGERSEDFKMAYAKYIGQREAAKLYMNRDMADHVDTEKLTKARAEFLTSLVEEAKNDPNLENIAKQIAIQTEKIS